MCDDTDDGWLGIWRECRCDAGCVAAQAVADDHLTQHLQTEA